MRKEQFVMKFDSPDNIWFTSDTHFGHKNISRFTKRPWNSTEEMDEGLIKNWNEVVGENDIVFHLGDFAFASNGRWKELIEKLNGRIYLILGNHDITRWPGDSIMDLFEGVYPQLVIVIGQKHFILNHYPLLCYGGACRNPPVYQLFGHVHSGPNITNLDSDRLKYCFPFQYDVGIDNNNYRPVSAYEIIEKICNYETKE